MPCCYIPFLFHDVISLAQREKMSMHYYIREFNYASVWANDLVNSVPLTSLYLQWIPRVNPEIPWKRDCTIWTTREFTFLQKIPDLIRKYSIGSSRVTYMPERGWATWYKEGRERVLGYTLLASSSTFGVGSAQCLAGSCLTTDLGFAHEANLTEISLLPLIT